VSPNHRAINRKQFPVNFSAVHLAGLQLPQDALPQAVLAPFAEAIVDGLPGSEPIGNVSPSSAIRQRPQNRIHHGPMVLPLAAPLSVLREEILDFLPLLISKLVGRRNNHVALLGKSPCLSFSPSTKLPKNSPDRT
jgi:hypothetical protein